MSLMSPNLAFFLLLFGSAALIYVLIFSPENIERLYVVAASAAALGLICVIFGLINERNKLEIFIGIGFAVVLPAVPALAYMIYMQYEEEQKAKELAKNPPPPPPPPPEVKPPPIDLDPLQAKIDELLRKNKK